MYHSLSIKNVQKETIESVSIEFEVPENLKEDFRFKAGQFLNLKADVNGEEIRRSYSICTTPQSNQLKVVVKQIPNGKFSTFANNQLKPGDVIEVSKPAGNFFLTPMPDMIKSYTLFAAGSGITPIISILKTILEEEQSGIVHLFYGNKKPELTIFKIELDELQKKYSDRLHVHYIFSQTKGINRFHTGRLEGRKLKKVFNKHALIENTDDIFMCGPQEMTDNIKDLLHNKYGFNPESIHSELFVSSKVQETKEDKKDSVSSNQSIVNAILEGKNIQFKVGKNETILEAGIAAGYDLPFSCQGGVCGVCRCSKGKGDVELDNNLVLSEEEVESGYILACQSRVLSDSVEINFD